LIPSIRETNKQINKKTLVSRTYKELLKFNNKKDIPIFKMAKGFG
jgi:hypothetical protein